jgi:hypothetical protein
MKNILLLFLLISSACFAQPKTVIDISKKVSLDRLKTNLYYLSSDKLEGRLMASHGDTLASLFVADWFKKSQLQAPYNGDSSYFQTITANKLLFDGKISIKGRQYPLYNGWFSPPFQAPTLNAINVPVVFAEYDFGNTSYNNIDSIDIKNKALIILLHGSPDSIDASIASFENLVIKKNGLAFMIIIPGMNSEVIKTFEQKDIPPDYENLFSASNPFGKIPDMLFSGELADSLLREDNQTIKNLQDSFFHQTTNHCFYSKSLITIQFRQYTEEVKAPNVIGVINGSDKKAGCIIISAHHDHEGKQGKKIYYGAVDNASGTSALIEMAVLMNSAVKSGYRPKRTIIFASFTGEERGLVGSAYYAEHPLYSMPNTYAVLNIDMLGRVDSFYSGKRADSNYVYVLVKDSLNRGLRKALYKANDSTVRLKLDTYYEQPLYTQRRIRGSDQYPFYLKGVPFIRIDCGFTKDYHKPTDTPDKINYPLLIKQTQLAFLTLWNIANEY